MTAREAFQAGKLDDAVQALNAELRDNPGDTKRRTFLFELLCFAGNYDRAEKQLEILAQDSIQARTGTLLYRAALHAERSRSDLFLKREFPEPLQADSEERSVSGSWNGKPFESISDGDSRIGARLEVFAAGQYMWIPFEQIASVEMETPRKLRDLLWAPAIVRPSAAFPGELGEVLLPALTPLSSRQTDDNLKLGRATIWQQLDAGKVAPAGQKVLLIDDEEAPILELRHLEIHAAPVNHHGAA